MEELEYDYSEPEDNKSSIRPHAVLPATSEIQPSLIPSSLKAGWQYEVSKEPYEDPPLFSQLRYHLVLKNLAVRTMDSMKAILAEEYQQKYNARAKNIYIRRMDEGNAANAFVGFQYDYEAFKVVRGGNKIEAPLMSKNGEKGEPEFVVTELFNHLIEKVGKLLEQQAGRYSSKEKRKSVSPHRPPMPMDKRRHYTPSRSPKRDQPKEYYTSDYRKQTSRHSRSRSRSIERRSGRLYAKRAGRSSSYSRERRGLSYSRSYSGYRSPREPSESRYSPRRIDYSPYRDYDSPPRPTYGSRRRYSRSPSIEKRTKEYRPEYRPYTHEAYYPPIHGKSSAPPLEEGEIAIGKALECRCYIFGTPFKATEDDIFREFDKRGLPCPKQLDFLKKGSLQVV